MLELEQAKQRVQELRTVIEKKQPPLLRSGCPGAGRF